MTANDSDVSDGDALTGSQVVRVYGENLTAPFVTLTFGGVEYVPFGQGEGYIEYIITNNGTAIIAVDGSQFMTFEVEGNTIPSVMTGRVSCRQVAGSTTGDGINLEITDNGCLNYPHHSTDDFPYFRVVVTLMEGSSAIDGNVTYVNCEKVDSAIDSAGIYQAIWILPTDTSKPCYLIYNGFIFFVGNYTTD